MFRFIISATAIRAHKVVFAFSAFLILCTTIGIAKSVANDQAATLQGLSLGETMQVVKSQLGQPQKFHVNESYHFWTYDGIDHATWRVAVEQHGRVVAIYVRTKFGYTTILGDGHGVVLNGRVNQLLSASIYRKLNLVFPTLVVRGENGVYRLYEIENDRIIGIALTRTDFSGVALGITYQSNTGFTLEDAIVIPVQTVDVLRWERNYIDRESCDYGGKWRTLSRVSIVNANRYYNRFIIECPNTKSTRPLFIDTTRAQKTRTQ